LKSYKIERRKREKKKREEKEEEKHFPNYLPEYKSVFLQRGYRNILDP